MCKSPQSKQSTNKANLTKKVAQQQELSEKRQVMTDRKKIKKKKTTEIND